MASLTPVQGALGLRRAAHLLRRASYRYTAVTVEEFAKKTAAEALQILFQPAPLRVEQPLYAKKAGDTPQTWINPPQPPSVKPPAEESELRRYVMAWWVNEALSDPGIGHKMAFFFHQFLAVDAESGTSSRFFDYLSLLRWGALGNFKKLVTKMILDNCMLEYIDNNQNYVNNPNTNYAREFFELHTIGKGDAAGPGDYTNYTEDDILEAARVLTGFNNAPRHQYKDAETNLPAGRAYPQSHDFKTKTFSARFGGKTITPAKNDAEGMTKELDELVDMVFAQEETARHLCRRLYRFFVTRNIKDDAEQDIIGGLATTLKANNFDVKPVVEQLLQSQHFFDEDDSSSKDEIIGALIKSPVELALQALTFFGLVIPDPVKDNEKHYMTFYNGAVLERMFSRAGLSLFYPPDVAGYTGYYQNPDFNRQFFNSATIIARYKLPQMLLTGTYAWGDGMDEPIGTQLDIAAWLRDSKVVTQPENAEAVVRTLIRYMMPEEPDPARFNYFYEIIFLDKLPPSDWNYEWENYVKTGDDSEVKIPLGRLLNALMYSPEYQLF
jgi:uncharacterized protein (DUF1800 family)